jgi:hypothetical protein
VARSPITWIALRRRHQHAYAPHSAILLRTRGERPRCRAAEERNEVAAFQMIELHSIPASQGRLEVYRIGEDQSAGIAGVLQPVNLKHLTPNGD